MLGGCNVSPGKNKGTKAIGKCINFAFDMLAEVFNSLRCHPFLSPALEH